MPFVERDVAVDPVAAREMVRRSGQMGVPVIMAGEEVVVGFDRPRLERIAAAHAAASGGAAPPRLGWLVKDRPAGGVEVGGARPGSLAERAGFQPGDVLELVDGQEVHSVADLERLTAPLGSRTLEAVVRRAGRLVRLRLG